MRVLITGGAGYIGSHTLVEVLNAGHEVLVVDNFCNSSPQALTRVKTITAKDFGFVELDIRKNHHLNDVLGDFAPDAVIHFAGLKSVGQSVEKPLEYFDTNVLGTINLLKVMRRANCKRLVFSSSAAVYGEPRYLPLDEDHPLASVNPYGRSKLHIEEMLRDQAQADGDMSIALLRYFNPVGAHASGLIGEAPKGVPDNLVPYIAQVAMGWRDLVHVHGGDYDTPDGTGQRDYIHVVDLARAHLAALDWSAEANRCRAFNLGIGTATSVLEMIKTFVKVSGRKIPYAIGPRRPGDVAISFADPIRAKKELNWQATNDIVGMCQSTWSWQETNPSGYIKQDDY